MAITETVAQRIRRLRTRQGLNQQELAERCGMHPSSMNQIEQGTRRPSTKTVTALARVLGTTRDAILDGDQLTQAPSTMHAEVARLRAFVRVAGRLYSKCFQQSTPLATIRAWRAAQRIAANQVT